MAARVSNPKPPRKPQRASGKPQGNKSNAAKGASPTARNAGGAHETAKRSRTLHDANTPNARRPGVARDSKFSDEQRTRHDRGDGGDPRGLRDQQTGPQARGSREARSSLPLDGEQVEGRRAVRELLVAAKRSVKAVFVSNELDQSDLIDEIKALAGPALRMVTTDRIHELARTESHQGVVAHAEPLKNVELLTLARDRLPFIVILDGVTDPGNVGAILRTADTAGVTGVVLPRKRSVHVSPTVAKSAAGAVEHVPIALVSGIPGAIDRLKRERVWIVGLDGDASQTLDDLSIATEPLALVLGAEGRGLAALTKRRCDILIKIPMYGHVESMNVSAAGAVAMHEIARRRART